jgi:hypothetical protein
VASALRPLWGARHRAHVRSRSNGLGAAEDLVLPHRVERPVWSDVVKPPVKQLAYAHRVSWDETLPLYVRDEVRQRALGRPLTTKHGTADPADLAVLCPRYGRTTIPAHVAL